LGDGEQYFLASDAWCYWCFPREHFTNEELRLVRHAEWARKQTVDEIIELIRDVRRWTDDTTVESALHQLVDQIGEATESRESKLQKRTQWEQLYNPQ
jgi:phenylalanyl-tRNA synthetase alpha subunit